MSFIAKGEMLGSIDLIECGLKDCGKDFLFPDNFAHRSFNSFSSYTKPADAEQIPL